ncbi:MAG: methylmalonyl-CoA epimerase [Planctomycetota bacterium]|nr:MAG: methylmalonyl-CoA epimerase [Planctomycetota bacterium]
MTTRLAHLGIAVQAHEHVLTFWRDLLGLELELSEHVASEGVAVAMLRLGAGSGCIELLQPDPGDNAVAKFLAKRGPGVHHVALLVDDLPGLMARMQAAGVLLLDEAPRPGAHGTQVAFVHPKSAGGVLVELVQE